ncbi:MAG: hypothetical protein K0R36_665 [Chryseobacterium sp.]|jgi:hypothetical protein|nr:hypothetical protein [Chryseobacterium sp.]
MINRIVLIGNGFDLAHGMKTGYRDFINSYWSQVNFQLYQTDGHYSSDDFSISYHYRYVKDDIFEVARNSDLYLSNEYINNDSFDMEKKTLSVNNSFIFQISKKSFENWVDIENEYYDILLELISQNHSTKYDIQKINLDLEKVKNSLTKYLKTHQEEFKHSSKIINHIKYIFKQPYSINDLSQQSKQILYQEKWEKFREMATSEMNRLGPYLTLGENLDNGEKYLRDLLTSQVYDEQSFYRLLDQHRDNIFLGDIDFCDFLSFNYTSTENNYIDFLDFNTIHIHGQLDNDDNPIIFGYGDELDDHYPQIEKLNDNDFLENMKSIHYSKTNNYKKLLNLLESGVFQVYVMGHSCGNSDRTLLNTIFEHNNCASIKIFYYQQSDTKDNYLDIYKNISRNFNDKTKLRDRVVNKQFCEPLVPIKTQKEAQYDLQYP